jgi:uncharacterized delta-60 repeat protein
VAQPGQGRYTRLARQSDGKLVVSSDINYPSFSMNVTRLLTNGTTDTTFGVGGTVSLPWSTVGTEIDATAETVDLLGRIVIGGWQRNAYGSSSGKFFVARLTSNGAFDQTYGVGGFNSSGSTVNLFTYENAFVGLTLQPDGKAILVGTTNEADQKFAVARFDGDPAPQIGSFTASPNPVTASGSVTLTASYLTDTNPGATITQVAFSYLDNSGNQHLLGDAAQTSPGVWTRSFSPSTFSLTSGTYTLFAQAEDSYGVFSDPLAITETVS